jgi:hypothetical protein
MKLRIMRLVGHVASMGNRKSAYRVFVWGNLKEREKMEDVSVDGKLLKCIFKK